ncbi:glycosyltransferase [Photobacterium sp. SDRW27]|uniref:glycosyltransferase n=1 Tax=Photobacterium obscurum TaxID=2829490 RepID=UPI0022432871|nr:glycosyltransferase [Photobacterium obscurum]MCW8332050.1 glycosyltransferase [Photobacterium obscurum]
MEILAFGEDWGRHPSSSQHILTVLLDQCDVTWVNSIGLRQPKLNWRDIRRVKEKLLSTIHSPAAGDPNTEKEPHRIKEPTRIIKPIVWPLAQSSFIQKLNNFSLSRQLKRKQQPRIIWAALPSAVDYLSICDSDLVIYYCGDDFSALAGVDHHAVTQAEQRLTDRADIILACSPALQRKFPANKTWLLPHGVSLLQFANPAPCPSDIDTTKPSVGFYGSLNNWLDQELLHRLAKARPEINFYLVGPVDTDIARLQQLRNIHLLPAKPHYQLAGYLQHWTMAILPFKDNDQIRACNPLKLREYLAAGCPVISSSFPAIEPYRPLASVATSLKEWLQAIDHYCQLSPVARQNYRIQANTCVANESWQNRANQVLTLIKEQLLSEKGDL